MHDKTKNGRNTSNLRKKWQNSTEWQKKIMYV